MGYYTSYYMRTYPDKGYDKEDDDFRSELLEIGIREGCVSDIKELLETDGVYAKLYDLTDRITEIAHKYPHLLICLQGDGEDNMDVWEQRWKGNDFEYNEAMVPPFDNPKLQIPKDS